MQERLRVRERLPERQQRTQDYEWDEIRSRETAARRKMLAERPRVIKFDSVPWEQSQSAYHKVFTTYDVPTAERKPWTAQMNLLRLMLQIVETGHKNANHRHYPEVPFYILQGKGHEVHDGRRHDWEAGDLMIVPPYCMHQHFCDEGPALLVYCQSDINAIHEGSEKVEVNENWMLPDDARPLYNENGIVAGYRRNGQEFLFVDTVGTERMASRMLSEPTEPSHPVSDDYEYYIRQFEEERYWRQHVPQVIRPQDRQWQDTRNGRMLWFLHPNHSPLQTGMRMSEIYVQELPPGARSGKHRHVGEEVHFIIEGSGYDVIDDVRWDWQANDVVATPVLSTHQSFNADPDRPARFISFKSRFYDYLSFAGIEHFEDAG
jgi:gentisate 1,2-dioxygenase